jgi:hypothetical protein
MSYRSFGKNILHQQCCVEEYKGQWRNSELTGPVMDKKETINVCFLGEEWFTLKVNVNSQNKTVALQNF